MINQQRSLQDEIQQLIDVVHRRLLFSTTINCHRNQIDILQMVRCFLSLIVALLPVCVPISLDLIQHSLFLQTPTQQNDNLVKFNTDKHTIIYYSS